MSPGKNGLEERSSSVSQLAPIFNKSYMHYIQCFSRCSWLGLTSLMAASLYLFPISAGHEQRVCELMNLPAGLKSGDDWANESTLFKLSVFSFHHISRIVGIPGRHQA